MITARRNPMAVLLLCAIAALVVIGFVVVAVRGRVTLEGAPPTIGVTPTEIPSTSGR